MSALTWLRALYVRYLDRHDPALYVTGTKFTTPTTYDQGQAIKAAQKAKRASETGRKYARVRSAKPVSNVLPIGTRRRG
jgi:hypothetical protein